MKIWWSLAVEQRHAANEKRLALSVDVMLEHTKYHVILPVGHFDES